MHTDAAGNTGREDKAREGHAAGTVDVSSAAPHYSLRTLNSFSTPPTFHIFLVIRQQSMLLCVAWAHCSSGLTDFYSLGFFISNRKIIAVSLPSRINMGLNSLFTSKRAQEEYSLRG